MSTAEKIYKSLERESVVAIRLRALLKSLRPQQWIKNGLVFLPFMFAIRQAWSLDDLDPVPGLIGRLLVVFAALFVLYRARCTFSTIWPIGMQTSNTRLSAIAP